MPRRNGAGPYGVGPVTVFNLGFCSGVSPRRCKTRGNSFFGSGLRLGLRCGRGGLYDPFEVGEKELLSAQRKSLEKRLSAVNKRLG